MLYCRSHYLYRSICALFHAWHYLLVLFASTIVISSCSSPLRSTSTAPAQTTPSANQQERPHSSSDSTSPASMMTMQEFFRSQQSLTSPSLPASQAQERMAKDFYIRGSSLQMQNNFAEAILEFQQSLRYQITPATLFAIAECYARLSKFDLALEYAEKTILSDSTFLSAYKLKAEICIVQLKLPEAAEAFEFICKREPTQEHRFTLARLYEGINPARALALYEQILPQTSNPEILARYADFARSNNRHRQAQPVLQKLLDLTDRDQAVFPVLMDSYLQTGDIDKAYSTLQTFGNTLADQDFARAYFTLGDALMRTVDTSTIARRTALLFSDSIPVPVRSFWQAYLMNGSLRYDHGDTAKGNTYFRLALQFPDSTGTMALQVANSYIKARAWQDIVDLLQPRYKGFPRDVRYPLFLGFAYTQLQRTTEAIQSFEQCLTLDSSMTDAWSNLGMLYNAVGKHSRSDSAYERALILDSTSAVVNNNYAYALSERGIHLERAKNMSTRALYAEPNNASYLDTMGWILFKMGVYNRAEEYILKAISAGDASATVYEHLGDVYEAMKNIPQALRAWKQAVQKDPQRKSTQIRLQRHTESNK
jgi:tetratricopeptide (TPR) repeat protein